MIEQATASHSGINPKKSSGIEEGEVKESTEYRIKGEE